MENETELIRQQMLETRTALSEKLGALQEQVLATVEGTSQKVTETVQTVQEAVQDTVSTVSESVQGTVDTVKKTFDLSEHMQSHPWLMLGGAVAVGYVGGRLLMPNGHTDMPAVSSSGFASANGQTPATVQTPARPSGPSWLEKLAAPLMQQAQTLAVGALAGIASDLIAQHAPEGLRGQLNEMAAEVARSMGAKPIHGLLSSDGDGRPKPP
jgi:ElaB/YqjD/DUF883 family membrane-anchored ribosome-binding protein